MNRKNVSPAGILIGLLFMLVMVISCEKEPTDSNYNPPEDHLVSKDGFMHKTGLEQPLTNCASCHGDDLRGGSTGVSCYECHDKEW